MGVNVIADFLKAQGIETEVREMTESTRTAQEAATAIGCLVDQIAKSLIFKTSQTHRGLLVISSGRNRVNEKKLGTLIGEPIEKAPADFVREKTGFAIGGIPPFCHREKLEILLDQDLFEFAELWAAAGTPHSVFRLTPQDLERLTSGNRISVK